MAESVYKGIELVGTSTESWEKAAASAVEKAASSLRDLRIAEVSELDLQIVVPCGRCLATDLRDDRQERLAERPEVLDGIPNVDDTHPALLR